MKWSLLSVPLFALVACGEHGSGDFGFDSRDVDRFSAVQNLSEVNLYLSVDPSHDDDEGRLTVTGDDNLIGAVRTTVRGETLVVETDYDVWPRIELRVVADVPALVELDNDGSGNVHVEGLDGDFVLRIDGSGDVTTDGDLDLMEVRCNGSGDARLEGSADRLEVTTTGSGDVHARDLAAAEATVSVSGSGDVEVCVTGTLDAASSGSGDIDFYCDPDVVYPSTSGSGDIQGH